MFASANDNQKKQTNVKTIVTNKKEIESETKNNKVRK